MNAPPKTIVVTGAARGLGRALAHRFRELGHTVLGCGRGREQVAELSQAFGAPHDFTALDVSADADVQAWAERLLAAHGAPDLLVNNAALMNRLTPLWEQSAEEIATIFAVNVAGVVNVLRHFVPAMVRKANGVVVNLSSGWGRSTSPQVAPYCATKYAVEGLTKALAQELPAGMAAVPLNPGIIDTDMLRGAWGDGAASYPSAEAWSRKAAPFLIGLGAKDNGKSLTVPQ